MRRIRVKGWTANVLLWEKDRDLNICNAISYDRCIDDQSDIGHAYSVQLRCGSKSHRRYIIEFSWTNSTSVAAEL